MRSIANRKKFFTSMEEDAQDAAGVAAAAQTVAEQAQEVVDTAEQLEASLVTLNEALGEGAADEGDVETAEETAGDLENMAEVVEATEEDGGLDDKGAAVLEAAVESLFDRVGLPRNGRILPSLESFGEASGKITSTRISVESIKEGAAKLWEKIVAAFNKAVEWLLATYNKLFDSATKLKASAEKAAKAAAALSDGAAGEKATLDAPAVFKKLAVGGAFPSDLSTAVATAAKIGEAIAKHQAEINGKMEKNTKEFAAGKLEGFATSVTAEAVPAPAGFSTENSTGTVSVATSPELPGGVKIVLRSPKNTVTGEAAIKVFSELKDEIVVNEPKEAKPINALNGADAKKVAASVNGLADVILAFKASQAKIGELKKGVGKQAMAKLNALKDNADANAAKAYLSWLRMGIDGIPLKTFSALITIGQNAVYVVEKSVKGATKGAEKGAEGAGDGAAAAGKEAGAAA